MSRTYVSKLGDTLNSISIVYYGRASEVGRLQKANPSIKDPGKINPGSVILIPDIPGETDKLEPPAAPLIGGDQDQVSLYIDNEYFSQWDSASVNTLVDGFASFTVSGPWDPTNADQREIFKPYQYKQVGLYIGNQKIATCQAIVHNPVSEPGSKTITVSGYALPGIFQDINPGPIEFIDANLQDIAEFFGSSYGVAIKFEADAGSAFKKVAIGSEQKIFDFLVELAKQRGLILSSNAEGECVFKQASTQAASLTLLDGQFPVIGCRARYNGQGRFSSFTALGDGWEGAENPLSAYGFARSGERADVNDSTIPLARPHTFQAKDLTLGELETAATAKLGRSIATSIELSVSITGWRDDEGELITEDRQVAFESQGCMIYRSTDFLIRAVNYQKTADALTATLTLVFPEAYTGQVRSSYPWD